MVTRQNRDLSRRTFTFALPAALGALRQVTFGEGGDQNMPGKPFQVHFDKALSHHGVTGPPALVVG